MQHGFFRELKRRHVYRVGVAYAVVGWLVIQLASTVLPAFGAPAWVLKTVIGLIVIGFPVALVLAWAFELTPEGMRRTGLVNAREASAPEQERKAGHALDRVIIGVLVVAVAFMAWRMWAPHKSASRPLPMATATSPSPSTGASATASAASAIPAKSIAVLPFENLSSDKANKYFSDGIQDLILTKLADIGDLAVISRTSTMKYGSHPESLKTVGKQLGVATILEGSVQKAGEQVLINVQLIDARNDHHIWANSYTRTLKNVFSVEGEVASKIASALNAKLSPAESQRLATTLSGNATANDLYLRGNYYTNQGISHHDVLAATKAIALYRKAIAEVPAFALARARLSMIESIMAWHGGAGGKVAPLYDDARAQAEQALKLAPNLPDAHVAMGSYLFYGKLDYPAALKAFTAALALRPNDSLAMAYKATALIHQGRFHEALQEVRQALAHDPRNAGLLDKLGYTYMLLDRRPEAEQALQHALAINPENFGALYDYSQLKLLYDGDVAAALGVLKGNNSPVANMMRVYLLTYARRYQDALAMLRSMPDTPALFSANKNGPKAIMRAYLYHLLGRPSDARASYVQALPLARAQYAAMKGSPAVSRSLTLIYVARAELGAGDTSAGLADAARVLATAEHSSDYIYKSQLMVWCAWLYADAGRPDQAVAVIAKALAIPGVGRMYSPVMLWVDPHWDPIRKSPAFKALQTKYAKDRPLKVPEAPKA